MYLSRGSSSTEDRVDAGVYSEDAMLMLSCVCLASADLCLPAFSCQALCCFAECIQEVVSGTGASDSG